MIRHLVMLPLLAGLLGGCAYNAFSQDPISQPGTWAPEGDNDANLRVMVADPNDLTIGKGAGNGLAAEAAPPVGLMLTGRRAALIGESSVSGATSAAPTGTQTPTGGASAGPQ